MYSFNNDELHKHFDNYFPDIISVGLRKYRIRIASL